MVFVTKNKRRNGKVKLTMIRWTELVDDWSRLGGDIEDIWIKLVS